MRWNKTLIFLLLASVMVLGEGCRKGPGSSTRKNSKKIKKGKPIPCPIKDC